MTYVEPRFPLMEARLVRVDKRGRVVIPKDLREKLAEFEGVFMWWDGRRLHLAATAEAVEEAGARAAAALAKKQRRRPRGRRTARAGLRAPVERP